MLGVYLPNSTPSRSTCPMPLLNDEVQATIKADPEADPPTNKKSIGPVPIIASAALAPESATSVQPQSLCKAACKSLKRDPLYYHPTLAASRLFDKVLFTPDASALPSPQGSKTGSADLEFSKVTADRVNSRDKASEAIGEHSDVTSTEGVSHAEHLMREGVQGNPLPMNQSRYEGSDPGLDRHGTPLVITEHDYWLRALNLAPIYTLADAFDAYSRLTAEIWRDLQNPYTDDKTMEMLICKLMDCRSAFRNVVHL